MAKKPPAKTTKTIRWDDALGGFMANLKRKDRSAHTTHHYTDDLGAFREWWEKAAGKVLTPGAIDDDDLIEWRDHLREQPSVKTGRLRKPAAINAKMAALTSFLHWAHRNDVIPKLPEAPERVKLGNKNIKWLTPDEQDHLMRAARKDKRVKRNREMVRILLDTGLRVAELVALRWAEVVLGERKGSVKVLKGKGCKPRGPLPLTSKALEAFKNLRALDPGATDGSPVFTSQRVGTDGRKKPLTTRGVQEALGRYKIPGWEHLHPHQLRHTAAINMKNGVPKEKRPPMRPEYIAWYFGHSSTKTTMDHYFTPSPRDVERAMNPDAADNDD